MKDSEKAAPNDREKSRYGENRQVRASADARKWKRMIEYVTHLWFMSLSPGGSMQIFIYPSAGRTITLDVCSSDFVEDVMEMIQHRVGLPPDQQRLIFKGQ